MQGAIAVFLITLGLGQLISTHWQLRGASLVGPGRWAGTAVGVALLAGGAAILPPTPLVLLWTLPAGGLALGLLLWGGSFVLPPPHPNRLFDATHPAHDGCRHVKIPDGDDAIPGFLLTPKASASTGIGVCLVPGAGDTKISFKWRLVQTLLAHGLTVLTIDPPGHGEYRHRALAYPDCLRIVPAAAQFLRDQPGITRVGLVGISLGGAIAINALAEQAKSGARLVEALVIFATPTGVNYSRKLFYRELWNTLYGAPVLWLLREASVRQIRESWNSGGYRSKHSLVELFKLLNPQKNIGLLKALPILLIYSRRDAVAAPRQAQVMRQAAPHACFIESKKASHVALTLMPEINDYAARWLREQLG